MSKLADEINDLALGIKSRPGSYAREYPNWNVRDMWFDCPTGANRREKMRRTSQTGANRDLRTELYHRGGMEALRGHEDQIAPFRIAVEWVDVTDAGRVELELPGIRRMLRQPERPRLTVARFSSPVGSAGYQFALGRLAAKLR